MFKIEEIERDNQGWGCHSIVSRFRELLEDENREVGHWNEIPEAAGMEFSAVHLDDGGSAENPIWEAYSFNGDVSGWSPEPPPGDGWFLVDIADTEDGPMATFARPREIYIQNVDPEKEYFVKVFCNGCSAVLAESIEMLGEELKAAWTNLALTKGFNTKNCPNGCVPTFSDLNINTSMKIFEVSINS